VLVDDQPVTPAVASVGAHVKAAVGFQATGDHEVVVEG
jgi:hypothetical protein